MSRPVSWRVIVAAVVVGALVGLWLSPGRGYSATVRDSPTVPSCQLEDSPGPCVWDARHNGNGKGQSFRRYRDNTIREVTHRRAHTLTH